MTLLFVVTSIQWTMTHRHNCRWLIIYFDVSRGSVWMAQARLESGLGRIRVPKPLSVVASVCSSPGLGVCLYYAPFYPGVAQQSQ